MLDLVLGFAGTTVLAIIIVEILCFLFSVPPDDEERHPESLGVVL